MPSRKDRTSMGKSIRLVSSPEPKVYKNLPFSPLTESGLFGPIDEAKKDVNDYVFSPNLSSQKRRRSNLGGAIRVKNNIDTNAGIVDTENENFYKNQVDEYVENYSPNCEIANFNAQIDPFFYYRLNDKEVSKIKSRRLWLQSDFTIGLTLKIYIIIMKRKTNR